ncbi:MAG: CDP-diacylglycerol O-phosphatidyltransferase, partial [Alphaproteobacteria bacterium]
ATSRFGAELDSLSDIAAFGIAPAIVLYAWTLHAISGIGWLIALAYAVCCALRLARFNAQLDAVDLPHKQMGFLTGVPAPVAAGLALTPLMIGFWTGKDEIVTPTLTAIYLAGVSFLMVSSLPTFSFRMLRLRRAYRLPLLVFVALFVALLTSYTWITLTVCAVLYLGSLPLAWRTYRRMLARRRGQAV